MPTTDMPVFAVEDDPFLRLIQVILDPRTSIERRAAFAEFMAHDLADFEGWCAGVRGNVPGLYPAEVRLVTSQDELHSALPGASVAVVESLQFGPAELALADRLRVV